MSDHVLEHEEHEHRDDVGARMAMWLFLFTELLLFGALFIVYTVFRSNYLTDFHNAASHLNTTIGAVNTLLLLTSSATMVYSIIAMQKNKKVASINWLLITIVFAIIFLVNKYFEWTYKFDHGVYLNSPLVNEMPRGEILFYGLYFIMTGLHAIHILIGIFLLGYVALRIGKNQITSDKYVYLENVGLYWHIVDLIWIYLFPLFYLIT